MTEPLLECTYTLEHIAVAARDFWARARDYRVFAFSGEMGAGKTTFIRALCAHLGVPDTVSSPTFSLINEYHFLDGGAECIMFHMDWYRLRDTDEAINAGVEDALLTPKAYCIVEWAEKAVELLPLPYLWVAIEINEDGSRTIRVYEKSAASCS